MLKHFCLWKFKFGFWLNLILLGFLSGEILLAASGTEKIVTNSNKRITSHSPIKKKPIIIAICPKSLDNAFFFDAKEAAELTARRLNVTLEWVAPFTNDPDMQVKIIKGLIRRKVNGIAVSCSDPDKLRGVISEACAAGIKVSTMDSDCPNSKRLFYCGTNNYKAGLACGQAMVKIINARNLAKKPLNTVILTGELGSDNLNERIRGFKDATTGHVQLKYITTLACNDDTTYGAKLLESYIKDHPETEVFYFTGGWVFIAPTESMPFYQAWCRRGGIAVSMDTFYPVLQAASRGFAQALVGQNFRNMGDLTVKYLLNAIHGKSIPFEYIDTGLEIADQSSFHQLLRVTKPWEMK
jgi:ribose transport system substrate-binding protein